MMGRITDPNFVSSRRSGMSGSTPSGLGFSYDGKLVRLGDYLTSAEGKALVYAVIEHFPQHAEIWKRYREGMPELDESMTLGLK